MPSSIGGFLRGQRRWLALWLVASAGWVGWRFFLPAAETGPLARLTAQVRADPQDFKSWNRLVDAQLRRYGATGEIDALFAADKAARASQDIEADPARNLGGLAMRTRVELAFHRCREAREDAERVAARLPTQPIAYQLLGDALFQQGDLRVAGQAWEKMRDLGETPAACEWRFAQLDLARGEMASALTQLGNAVQSARVDPHSTPDGIAWYQVQWGEAAFRSGDWKTAETQYAAALAACPKSYTALEHIAELRGAQGRTEEAAGRYRALIDAVQRPELMQALGDLYLYDQRPEQAAPWYDKALAGYLAAVRGGNEALYGHHLAGFFSDARLDAAQAVAWAERDLQERQNTSAHDALAWALCKAARLDEAVRESDLALACGCRDAHILYHAGVIHMAANDPGAGAALLRRAVESNPSYNTFHVHR